MSETVAGGMAPGTPDSARIGMDERAETERFGRNVVAADARAIAEAARNLDGAFADAVTLLSQCQGKVLVAGLGTSGTTARRIAHLLSVAGTPAFFIHPADGLHGGLGGVSAQDVLVAISKGGESDELNEFVRRAKQRGARTVSLTGDARSPLALLCDIALRIVVPDDVDPGGMIATASSLAASAVGDALAMATMRARRYSWQSFEFTHPGGAVGKMIGRRGEAQAR